MTQAPYFVPGSDQELQREAVLNFKGGSVTTTRGVLAAMFSDGDSINTCAFEDVPRSRSTYTRSEYVGAPVRSVDASSWTQKKYASQAKGLAAGGEPIMIRINGEFWSARLSGRHEDFMTFLCDSKSSLKTAIAWKSARGTYYGPIFPTTGTN